PGFKKWWTKIVPVEIERSTFVLITCILLISMFILWQPLPAIIWNVTDPVGQIILTGLALLGAGIVLVSTFIINHFDLFGLRQVWLQFIGKPYTFMQFKKRGLYKYL